jgi:antitoxin (DNA-binding transcriptional repressor) of toxin-antitoxin stability system
MTALVYPSDRQLTNMTTDDYHMTMNDVRIADLKARLSEHLRAVRRGRTLTVLDRDRAIARIVPYDAERGPLTIRSPRAGAPTLAQVSLPPPLRMKLDIVELLAEERQPER